MALGFVLFIYACMCVYMYVFSLSTDASTCLCYNGHFVAYSVSCMSVPSSALWASLG